jgi:hypothetical protein
MGLPHQPLIWGMAMAKQTHRKKPASGRPPATARKPRDSVFREAWENMNEDMARVLPDFLVKRLRGGKGKVWVVALVTLVELVVLGAAGKFVYDWFVNK